MKKLLVLTLVLALTSVSFATLVGLGAPAEGEPGSMTNPLDKSDTIIIPINIDTGGLYGLDAIIEVQGPGTIEDYLKPGNEAAYGWDATLPVPPITDGLPTVVETGGAQFNGNMGPVVGFVEIHCEGPGEITVTILPGAALGGSADLTFTEPDFGGPITIYQIPEPMTVALLGLGGLFLRRRK